MLTKSKLAFAAALILGAASAAQAANDNQSDPTRGFPYGPEGQRVGGDAVNPVHHESTRKGGRYANASQQHRVHHRKAPEADDTKK
jgi:hypothetical protein